ncbi:iron chelate uptake ABC transporter family permease subunit [Aurantimonas sp. Leaf443]|uniref:iron chelate uptake ABC transporter family permease subunit n=1 Tax=Aurantimonas sp. Leaf443 TaxID=1736378 RepID=UPI0006F5D201|nr:iron chelate uptake ABC transporter family permease subunit [Aurantimonas sp. Leaf443]KQT82859.1 enterobactin ABC transporter permease [Aurantimonas sp. Leaf443]
MPLAIPVLVLVALAACLLFLTLGARGDWSFVLTLRGGRLAAMVIVAHAVAVSTVVFQTIAGNRILTPSIMGFDALYALIQTVLVFLAGAAFAATLDPRVLFVGEVAALVVFAGLLYGTLLSAGARDLHRLLLVGIILGVLFRSLAGLLQRLIDPNEFVVLQDRLYASFGAVPPGLLAVSAAIVLAASLAVWRLRRVLDVLALGRERSIALGVDHRRLVFLVLALVAVLVSVSTALVGPVTFFGLLVAALATSLVGGRSHALLLPAASLVAIVCIVGGQTILERLLGFDGALGMVVEFVGGLVFLALLLRKGIA